MRVGIHMVIGISACALLCACGMLGARVDSETEASVTQAKQLRQQGYSNEALGLLTAAHGKYPNDPVILQQLGYALIETGQFQEAIATFDALIAAQPANAMAHNGKAVAFDHAGNHLAAQDIYKTALSIVPDSIAINNNLAKSLMMDNKPKLAITLLEDIEDTNPTVKVNLEQARRQLKESASKKTSKKNISSNSSTIGFIDNTDSE